jgi:hypothetical protein
VGRKGGGGNAGGKRMRQNQEYSPTTHSTHLEATVDAGGAFGVERVDEDATQFVIDAVREQDAKRAAAVRLPQRDGLDGAVVAGHQSCSAQRRVSCEDQRPHLECAAVGAACGGIVAVAQVVVVVVAVSEDLLGESRLEALQRECQFGARAVRPLLDQPGRFAVRAVEHAGAVDSQDPVAASQPGLGSGRVGANVIEEGASERCVGAAHVPEAKARLPALHLALVHKAARRREAGAADR